MSNKTISINPALFSISSIKTRKKSNNGGGSKIPKIMPVVSPNLLKQKLLKRIKEHKLKETSGSANDSQKETSYTDGSNGHFDNEFNDSMNYLASLSSKAKKDERKAALERKTVKNHHAINHSSPSSPSLEVSLDLPNELQKMEEPMVISPPPPTNDVPYGILKGGAKPTYRQWARTQKNRVVVDPNSSWL